MVKYVIKRILFIIPTCIAVAFIVFSIMAITPSSPGEIMLGLEAKPEDIAALNHKLGYDRPFFVRFGDYVWKLVQGDMGTSYQTGRPVFKEIMLRFPVTLKLTMWAILFSVVIGVPLGILSAAKQYSALDFGSTTLSMFMASMPTFWLGLMFMLLFALQLRWLPFGGTDTWKGYVLPAITLGLPSSAGLLRLTRTLMLECIRQDYVRTARSKGQRESLVIFGHALQNSLIPLITSVGMHFGALLGGAVAIETVFSINGLGTLAMSGIRMKDLPQVMGSTVFFSVILMVVMLVVDILYAYLDPRIRSRYQKA